MKKINIIKENKDFARIMKTTQPYKNKDFLIFVEKNINIKPYHFGISVSKKLGNAVMRNKLKRQIKAIIDKKDYQNNFNCIIILRKDILNNDFQATERSLFNMFDKINIIKGESDEE